MKTEKDTVRSLRVKSNFLFAIGGCFIFTGLIGMFFFGEKQEKTQQTKATVDMTITKQDPIEIEKPDTSTKKNTASDKRVGEQKRQIQSLVEIQKVELTKLKDTLSCYSKLVNLLATTKRLYGTYKANKYDAIYADSIVIINDKVITLLDDKGSFFRGVLTQREIELLKDYYDRWKNGYNKWDRKPGTQVNYQGSKFPSEIGLKITDAYDKYNKQVGGGLTAFNE